MEFKNRPTFGATAPVTEEAKSNEKSNRPEVGAVWKRQSKTNMEYMSIKLELTKEKLQSLLLKEGETVQVNFIAFPNKTHNGNTSRPNFRIYEELLKEST